MPLAVITGGSGGIGLAIARELAGLGYDLALISRRTEALEAAARNLAPAKVFTFVADLSEPVAPAAIAQWLRKMNVPVDVLINNAGFGSFGSFAEEPVDLASEMISVNIAAVTTLTRLLLPEMIVRKSGYVMNVASVASFVPGPLMAVYYASKAYVLSFSEALREELNGTGVSITALCPGVTETGFQERASLQRSRLMVGKPMGVNIVARAGVRGMLAGKSIVIPGISNQIGTFLVRFAPRGLVAKLVRRAQEPVQE